MWKYVTGAEEEIQCGQLSTASVEIRLFEGNKQRGGERGKTSPLKLSCASVSTEARRREQKRNWNCHFQPFWLLWCFDNIKDWNVIARRGRAAGGFSLSVPAIYAWPPLLKVGLQALPARLIAFSFWDSSAQRPIITCKAPNWRRMLV